MANEKRLIYLEDALKAMPALEMCTRALLRLPTVDAVEVVRCKDCKKGHSELAPNGGVWCAKWNHVFGDDGYCYYGERKTED